MVSEVVMPQMGADMTEGTVLRWLKQEGDAVTRGEIIAEIETDKANVEIEAFESGVFRKAIASEGDVVQVGEVIAVIAGIEEDISRYTNGAASTSAKQPGSAAPTASGASAPATADVAPGATTAPAADALQAPPTASGGRSPQPSIDGTRLRVSPVARRIADERGIDLRQVKGTGPDGRVVKRDVESFAAPSAAPAAPRPAAPTDGAGPVAMSKMRQAIARRMAQSKREAPHYYLLAAIDMTEAMDFRRKVNDTQPEDARVSVNDLIVRACAIALQRHPMFNATIASDEVETHYVQNVCIAIALDDGLIAPAILDAGTKSLLDIASESKDLAARAKGGSLRPDEITAGTFTITNLGAYGVETLIGIIQPPQTAILGVGSVAEEPVVRDGEIVVRQVMKVALSADHRVTDGAQGAGFLGEVRALLEQPLRLVL